MAPPAAADAMAVDDVQARIHYLALYRPKGLETCEGLNLAKRLRYKPLDPPGILPILLFSAGQGPLKESTRKNPKDETADVSRIRYAARLHVRHGADTTEKLS